MEYLIIRKINTFHHSDIPLFIIIILSASLLFGCAGTERFGKKETEKESDSRYEKNKEGSYSALEIVNGVASYYSDEFHGRKTANGETYDMYGLTAAHKTFPFDTKVRLTNLANGKSVTLRINDRMPNYNKREIDISFQAARELGMIVSGIADVKIEILEWGE
jgi:rare lipoprotein A